MAQTMYTYMNKCTNNLKNHQDNRYMDKTMESRTNFSNFFSLSVTIYYLSQMHVSKTECMEKHIPCSSI
jgi:hypothetical protein